ncbi:MAG: thioredoxin [Planctomycetota bacterium]
MSSALDVTDSSWDTEVLQSAQPVLVDFWAPWCGPCKAMGPYIDKLAEEFAGRLKVVKLNTQDNNEVPAQHGITAIPTLILVKGGEVVDTAIGLQRYEALKSFVEPHM